MTRAIPVTVERSPGGLRGWSLAVGPAALFTFAAEVTVLAWVTARLAERGASVEERWRVVRLVAAELKRMRRVEVLAEVRV